MAEDVRLGVLAPKLFQQFLQGDLLLRRTGIGRFAVGRQPALVADADGVLVVASGMCTDELLVAGVVCRAVLSDVVVVTGEPEAGIVACDEVLDGEPTVTARGAAVDNDQINFTHRLSSG